MASQEYSVKITKLSPEMGGGAILPKSRNFLDVLQTEKHRRKP